MPLLCLVTLAFLMSCNNRVNDSVVGSEQFLKIEQEVLGDQIWRALVSDNTPFNILAREENIALYEFVENLHAQSFTIIRGDGWTKSRNWNIAIIEDENQTAFTLPGGHHFISTGMLKTFRQEYELFYLFCFENSLINSREVYLDNLLSNIENSIVLEDLIANADPEMALQIGIDIHEDLTFNPAAVAEVDGLAMDLICKSSTFRTDGINAFLPILATDSQWAISRESSFDRLSAVNNNFQAQDCSNNRRFTVLGPDFYADEIVPLIP